MSSENEPRSTRVTFADEMSRLRSDTYIKPGSESSYDSDDLNMSRYGQHLDNYCYFPNVSAKMAVIISAIVTGSQAVGNFAFLLHGCGITSFDMLMAALPIVFGTAAVLFIIFAFMHHSSCSLKPYIAHHINLAVLYFSSLVLFALVVWRQQFAITALKFLSEYSSNFGHILETDQTTRFIVGGYLFFQLVISFFCLHLSGSLFTWLDTEKRYISTEGTEVC